MANILTKGPLMAHMRKKLQTWNRKGLTITNDTVHRQILSDIDGFKGSAPSKKQYYAAIRWVMWDAGAKDVRWPNGWMDLSVNELADYIMEKQNA